VTTTALTARPTGPTARATASTAPQQQPLGRGQPTPLAQPRGRPPPPRLLSPWHQDVSSLRDPTPLSTPLLKHTGLLPRDGCCNPDGIPLSPPKRVSSQRSTTETLSPSPAPTPTPQQNPRPRTSMLSPPASTSPSPSGITSWLTLTQVPTAIQLAIHSIRTDILPDHDKHQFTFIQNSIYNAKVVKIGAARYLNNDRAARRTKQATSVVVSINLNDGPILLPALLLL